MTKRQIAARAISPEHKKLMLAYRNAAGGHRTKARKALQDFMTAALKAESKR